MPTTIHIPRAASPYGSRIPIGINGTVSYIPTGQDYTASDAEVAALQALNIQIQMTDVPAGFILLSQRLYGSRVGIAINGRTEYLLTGVPIAATEEQKAVLVAAGRAFRGGLAGFSILPSIVGTPRVGQPMVFDDGLGPVGFFASKRELIDSVTGLPLASADAPTPLAYTPLPSDQDKSVFSRVTFSLLGVTVSASSAVVVIVAAADVMPLTQTVPFSARTPVGYGGHPMYYTGSKFLGFVGGTGSTDSSGKWRINSINHLVTAGNVTGTVAYPTGLAANYVHQIAEFEDAARTVRTDPSKSYTVNVPTTGSYTFAEHTVTLAMGGTAVLPAMTVDLARTWFVSEWPRTGTNNDTLSRSSAANNQINKIGPTGQLALGDSIVMRPVAFNPPYDDGVHAGTVDYDVRPSLATPTGTWTGTPANNHMDGNFVQIMMENPSQTMMGYLLFFTTTGIAYYRFIRCRFRRNLPSLNRSSFASFYTPGASPANALLFFQGSPRYLHIDQNVFDMEPPTNLPAGVTNANNYLAAGLKINIPSGGTDPVEYLSVTNNVTGFSYDGLLFENAAGGTVPSMTGIVIRNNRNTGKNLNDTIKLIKFWNMDIQDNTFMQAGGQSGTGVLASHPDNLQISWTGLTAGVTFQGPRITGNMIYQARANGEAGGQGLFFTGGSAIPLNTVVKNNIVVGSPAAGITVLNGQGTVITNNTVLREITADTADGRQYPTIITSGTDATVTDNTVSAAINTFASGNSTYANNIVIDPIAIIKPEDALAAPVYGAGVTSRAQAIAAYKAKAGGPLDGTGTAGRTIGAYKTDGTLAV